MSTADVAQRMTTVMEVDEDQEVIKLEMGLGWCVKADLKLSFKGYFNT